MNIVILVLVAVALTWLVYLGHGKVVQFVYRLRRDGDDPIQRAYAPELASVEQTAGLLHMGWFFIALVLAVLAHSILLGILVGVALGIPVALWEGRRVKEITT